MFSLHKISFISYDSLMYLFKEYDVMSCGSGEGRDRKGGKEIGLLPF